MSYPTWMFRAFNMLPKTVFMALLMLCISTYKCDKTEGAFQLVETKATNHVPSASQITSYASSDHQNQGAEVLGNQGYVTQSTTRTSQDAEGHDSPGYVAKRTSHSYLPQKEHEASEGHEASATGGHYGCASTYGGYGYGHGHGGIGLVKPRLLIHKLVGVGTKISKSLGVATSGIIVGIEGLKKLAAAGVQIKTGLTKAVASIPFKVLKVVTTGAVEKVRQVKNVVKAGVSGAAKAKEIVYVTIKGHGGYGGGKGIKMAHHGGGKGGAFGGHLGHGHAGHGQVGHGHVGLGHVGFGHGVGHRGVGHHGVGYHGVGHHGVGHRGVRHHGFGHHGVGHHGNWHRGHGVHGGSFGGHF